jgi:hypothetical protein
MRTLRRQISLSRRRGLDLAMNDNSETASPRLMQLISAALIITLSGCAQGPAPEPMQTAPAQAERAQPGHAEPGFCHPDRALLTPQPVPDCAFRRAHLKTMDPDLWARLKIEYERECYQNAEKVVRHRLRLLQAANLCEAQTARR